MDPWVGESGLPETTHLMKLLQQYLLDQDGATLFLTINYAEYR